MPEVAFTVKQKDGTTLVYRTVSGVLVVYQKDGTQLGLEVHTS